MLTLKKPKTKKILWVFLLLFSAFGITFMFVSTYAIKPSDFRYIKDGQIIGKDWYEKLILPFYFTFISNFMALIVSFSRVFNIIKNIKIRKKLETLTTINLTITLLVYWTLLFPLHIPKGTINWITNMSVHLIVPIFLIFMFNIEYFRVKDETPLKVFEGSAWNLLFPVIWVIISSILYYSLGADKGAAVYNFLDFNHLDWYMILIYILGIGVLYYFVSVIVIKIGNSIEIR